MLMSIAAQCEGFDVLGKSDDYRITLRDFSELEQLPVDESLTSAFSVRRGIFLDHSRRFGWRESSDQIEFWHDAGLRLSIPYLLQLGLVKNGRSFVHSAAVAYGSQSFIFPAFGGVGKTLLVSQLVANEGFRLLGDDLCVIAEDGLATAYPRPFCLYEHHREVLRPVFEKFGVNHFWPNILGRAVRRLRDSTNIRAGMRLPHNRYQGIIGDYVLVSPIKIYGNEKICSEALPIGAIVLLRREPRLDRIRIDECSRDYAARFASNVTLHEWKAELPAMLAGTGVIGRTAPYEDTGNIMRNAFHAAKRTLILSLPQRINIAEYVDAVTKIIRSS